LDGLRDFAQRAEALVCPRRHSAAGCPPRKALICAANNTRLKNCSRVRRGGGGGGAESHHEKRETVAIDFNDSLEIAQRDAARLEADEKAAAREWTRRLIESGSGTSRDDNDESDVDPHHWGGDAGIIDDKVGFISAFCAF
jgi:hypothetical protein